MLFFVFFFGFLVLCLVFALWLKENKGAEPDHTWAEVVIGVGYTLLGAHLHNVITRGDWRQTEAHILEAFCYSAPPIIVGELWQAWEAYRVRRKAAERDIHEAYIDAIHELKYEDLMQ